MKNQYVNCTNSPLAKVKRLGQQYQQEQDKRVRQQLLLRMLETLSFLDTTNRSIIVQRACGKNI